MFKTATEHLNPTVRNPNLWEMQNNFISIVANAANTASRCNNFLFC